MPVVERKSDDRQHVTPAAASHTIEPRFVPLMSLHRAGDGALEMTVDPTLYPRVAAFRIPSGRACTLAQCFPARHSRARLWREPQDTKTLLAQLNA